MAEGIPRNTDTVPHVFVPKYSNLQCSLQLSRIPGEACYCFVSQEEELGKVPRGTDQELGMHCHMDFIVYLTCLQLSAVFLSTNKHGHRETDDHRELPLVAQSCCSDISKGSLTGLSCLALT